MSYPKSISLFKYLFLSIFILPGLSAFSQDKDAVLLKWKLKPNEVIVYKTVMQEIDTASHMNISFGGLDKLFGDSTGSGGFQKILSQLNQVTQNDNMITSLKENRKNIIDIEMKVDRDQTKTTDDTAKSGSDLQKFQSLMKLASSGAMLRGAIYEDGTIESFYTPNDQRNLLALFFELPGKPVKIGDSWPLNVHFISMDQNFICDSSTNKNEVTVTNITNNGNEQIITLRYNILEYVHGSFSTPFNNQPIETSMKVTYQAIANFSIEKGRWIDYNGIMSLSSTGMMSAQSTKKFSLVTN